jgi:hypothetical protein
MSAHGFKSVFMVGAIAGTALACYLVSLRVASERAELESVENKIVLAQRDIRLLNTEIGTRGRLAQLERWNVKVIRLSAPTADQFVESSFQLATLAKPEARPAVEAPLVYASAPAPARREPVVTNDDGSNAAPPRASRPLGDMMHVAGYSRPATRPVSVATRATAAPLPDAAKSQARPEAPAAKPKPRLAAKTTAPAAKPVKIATADPLGPLSASKTKAKSDRAAASSSATKSTKESGSR